jgi:hypothetical protein
MKSQKQFPNESVSHLRVVKGGKKKEKPSEHMIKTAWLFAQSSLWERQNFTEDEISKFKKLIREFFEEKTYREGSLIEFCERITIAKRYMERSRFRRIAAPINWLDARSKYGISGTQHRYNEIKKRRETDPEYYKGMRIFAESMLNYVSSASPAVYRDARKKLIEQRQVDLISTLNSIVTAFHYLNQ